MNAQAQSPRRLARVLALAAGILAVSAWAQPRNEVAFYVAAYGEVTAESDPLAARAHAVFGRVRAVADKNTRRLPSLVVVDGPGDPWAIALPSGHVVLSLRALRICGEDEPSVDACLAFVIGHELAHLAHEDFWHREVHAFLAAKPTTEGLESLVVERRAAAARELAADDQGFIYAALAGYPVDRLLEGPSVGGFFANWARQTQARIGALDAAPDQRALLLSQRLQTLLGRIEFFHFGVRLSHFGYCDDAVYFFREFQKTYPGREVLNNLGQCYLQLAMQNMEPARALFYWMPLMLDGETRVGGLDERRATTIKSLSAGGSETADEYLQRAIELLDRSVAADPLYMPAAINLAVAQLFLGRPHSARAALEAFEPGTDTTRIYLGILKALVLYEQSDVDTDLWPAAVARLERLAEDPRAAPMALFNLARMMEIRSRTVAARSIWGQVARTSAMLPDLVRDVACAQLDGETPAPAACDSRPSAGAVRPPGDWPIQTIRLESARASLPRLQSTRWESIPFDWYTDQLSGRILTRDDRSAMILELDEFVQMQVLRSGSMPDPSTLAAHCPRGLAWREMVSGRIASCGTWAALVDEGSVRELWWLAQ